MSANSGRFVMIAFATAAAAGLAFGNTEPAPSGPAGAARILAADAEHVLFEGEQDTPYGRLPDGRIWLLERSMGTAKLLTRPADFGENFFASGGVLAPDGLSAIVHVNFDDDPGNLYLIDLRTAHAEFLADARGLGLGEIVERTIRLSPDGSTLAFAAFRELEPPTRKAHPAWDVGVFALSLSGDLELRLLASAEPGTQIYPEFSGDGRLWVRRGRPPASPGVVPEWFALSAQRP